MVALALYEGSVLDTFCKENEHALSNMVILKTIVYQLDIVEISRRF